MIPAQSVGSFRHRNALGKAAAVNRELRKHPTIGNAVIRDNRIAVVVYFAGHRSSRSTQTLPQEFSLDWTKQAVTGCLVKDRKRSVDPLHKLRLTHCAAGIGRCIL